MCPRQAELTAVIVTLCLLALLIVGFLLPAMTRVRTPAKTTDCKSNLKMIGLTLIQYQNEYGGISDRAGGGYGTANECARRMHELYGKRLDYLPDAAVFVCKAANDVKARDRWDAPVNPPKTKFHLGTSYAFTRHMDNARSRANRDSNKDLFCITPGFEAS